MSNFFKKNFKYIILFIILCVFYSIMPFVSDDWGLYHQAGLVEKFFFAIKLWFDYSGRVLGQTVVTYLGAHEVIKIIFQAVTSFLTIYLLEKFDSKKTKDTLWLVLILLFAVGCEQYSEIFSWLNGFSYYVFPCVMMLIYLNYAKKAYEEDLQEKKMRTVTSFICGVLMNFFIENIAALSVFIGLYIVITTYILKKKAYRFQVAFLIGAILGCGLMMAAPVYWGNAYQYRFDDVPWFPATNVFTKINFNLFYDKWWGHFLLINKIALCFMLTIVFLFDLKKDNSKIYNFLIFFFFFINVTFFGFYFMYFTYFKSLYYEWSTIEATITLIFNFLWFITLILLTHYKYQNNQKKWLWMFGIILSAIVVSCVLLVGYNAYYTRCYYPANILLILYLVDLKNDINVGRAYYAFLIGLCVFVIPFYSNIAIANYNNYHERLEIIEGAQKHNYDNIIFKGYPYRNFVHCFGEVCSGFHFYAFNNYYGLSMESNYYVVQSEYECIEFTNNGTSIYIHDSEACDLIKKEYKARREIYLNENKN